MKAHERMTTDEGLIKNKGYTNRLSGPDGRTLLKIAKEFMSEYYDEDIKIRDNNLYFYKKGKKDPDVFSWYQVTIQILPNFITERFKYNDFDIDRLDSGQFKTFGNQLSLMLVEGRIDGLHNRWDDLGPVVVLNDYIKKMKTCGIL